MNDRKRIIRYFLLDLLSAYIAWLVFDIFRFYVFQTTTGFETLRSFLLNSKSIWLSLTIPFFWTVIYYYTGYYAHPRRKTNLGDFLNTAISTLIGVLIIFFAVVINDYPESPELYYDIALGFYIIHFFITWIFRLVQTAPLIVGQSRGKHNVPILIVGTGANALKVLGEFNHNRSNFSFKLKGFVRLGKEKSQLPESEILGNIEDLHRLIEEYQIEELILAVDNQNPDIRQQLLGKLYIYGLPIKSVATSNEIISGKVALASLYGIPMTNLTPVGMPEWQKNVKKTIDRICSLVMLILLLPVYIYLACRVRQDSPGKILYKQDRVGKGGKAFQIYKFRTMYENAEDNGPMLSFNNDPRVTPYGRTMRKYRLDELPQFLNVLKGEMSMVGPRPERQYFVDQIVRESPHYYLTQRVLPGITSWGMVKYGYANTVEKMAKRLDYDILYLENQSLLVDLKILIFTIIPLVKGKGV